MIRKSTLQKQLAAANRKIAKLNSERKAKPATIAVDAKAKSRFKLDDMTRERMRVKPQKQPEGKYGFFTPAQPAPGVVPKAAQMAMDNAFADTLGSAWGWAGGGGGVIGYGAFAEGLTFLGYPYLSELTSRPEYRVISEVIATEMTRKFIRIQANGDGEDQNKEDKIKLLNAAFERFNVKDNFTKLAELDGFFGRAHLYIDTGDSEDRDALKLSIGNGRDAMSKAKLKKGCLKKLKVIEPIWTYPTSYNSNEPWKNDWYNPNSWFVMGTEFHSSRLLTFVGREVPDLLKPAYSFGGLSLSQMAKPYIDNWLLVRQSVSDIIQAFTVFVLKTDLETLLQPGANDALFDRADLFNNLRNNRNLMMVNKDTEDFANVSASLAGLDLLQAQAQEHMASVSRIPLIKLLGISPQGLNASSEGELRAFYDTISAYQEKFFRDKLNRVFDIIQINEFGEVDPELHYTFEPLWSLDEKAQADVRKVEADTDSVLIADGILSPEEARKRVANDPDTPYANLNVNDMPIPPMEEQQQGGGMFGEKKPIAPNQGSGLGDPGVTNFTKAAA